MILDKNPGDESAHERFQAIGEAYQVLSNKDLRAAYDRYGKEQAMPSSGFEDPSEFFGMIFGGEAFVDLIGEISLMKDLTHTMDIAAEQMEEEELAKSAEEKLNIQKEKEQEASATTTPAESSKTTDSTHKATTATDSTTHIPPPSTSTGDVTSPSPEQTSGTSTPRRRLGQQAIMEKSEEDARMDAAGLTPEEKDLRKKEKKKGGLTKEQREKLDAYERERRKAREERVDTLSKKLIERISVWTETDKGRDGEFEDGIFRSRDSPCGGHNLLAESDIILEVSKVLGYLRLLLPSQGQGYVGKGNLEHYLDSHRCAVDYGRDGKTGGERWRGVDR